MEDDEETQRRLSKLEKFAREELESVPLIREKLCFLVSSLPAHEICTPQMQVRMTSKGNWLESWMSEQRSLKYTPYRLRLQTGFFPDVLIVMISLVEHCYANSFVSSSYLLSHILFFLSECCQICPQ